MIIFFKYFCVYTRQLAITSPPWKQSGSALKPLAIIWLLVLRPSRKHIYGDVLESRWRAKCDHARSSPCSHQQYIRRAQVLKWQPIKKCWKIQLNFYAAFTFEDNFWNIHAYSYGFSDYNIFLFLAWEQLYLQACLCI